MNPDGRSLLRLMFNDGETVCPSNNKYSYHSIPLENAMDGRITLVSKDDTKLRYCDPSDLILVGINPINGFRLDENVTVFRSFLWEVDVGTIPEQIKYLKALNVPISAQVFSGNKSVHAITVLDEPIENEKTYRYLYEWAHRIITLADKNCKNPSRSIRIPGAYREPNKQQRLISIGKRIKTDDFMKWLRKYEHLRPTIKEKRIPTGKGDFGLLSPWARGMISKGVEFSKRGRNQTWYALAMDFALAGYTEEQTIEKLSECFTEERDFKEKEFLVTIGSAFKKVNES